MLQVEVSKLDVADMDEAKGVVALAQKQAPVGGIFHLAMILQDRWMANQVTEQALRLLLYHCLTRVHALALTCAKSVIAALVIQSKLVRPEGL